MPKDPGRNQLIPRMIKYTKAEKKVRLDPFRDDFNIKFTHIFHVSPVFGSFENRICTQFTPLVLSSHP